MSRPLRKKGHRAVLIVLFIPSVERNGATPVDQPKWVLSALETLGTLFGGATAYPKARGVWRDDDNNGALIMDEPVIIHCYTTPHDAQDETKLHDLSQFCNRLLRETNQGEVGLVIGDDYYGIV